MGLDALKSILDKKLVSLTEELEEEKRQIDGIANLQETIRVIKENPYILCTSEGEKYIKLLGLEKYNIPTLKKIYDGYVLLGREAIPQISIVEDTMGNIVANLEQKVCFLSDLIVKHQASVIVCEDYKNLSVELSSEESYVTQFGALRSLLESSDLSLEDKNGILKEIIDRNNAIHRKRILEVEARKREIEASNESHYSKAISVMRNELETTFGVDSLKYLESISKLLDNCSSASEIESVLEGWDYSLGRSYCDIIDGVITLKNIDILDLQDTFGEDDQDVRDEVTSIKEQISVLSSYRDSITMDRDAEKVDTPVMMNEYEKAIHEYNDDPLSYPNRVFFLNNAVGRDIDGIKDKETLQDLFLLLENLKKGNVQAKTLSDFGAREIKPSKRGRQARIRYAVLDDNVCVILQILERKSDKSRGEQQTLKLRQKEVVGFARELNSNPAFVDDLVDITRVHSEKLLSLVTKTATNKVGGVS